MRQKQRIDTVTETTTSKFYCFQSGKIKFHRIITSDVRCKGNLFSKDKVYVVLIDQIFEFSFSCQN